jgi:hypothetical protein
MVKMSELDEYLTKYITKRALVLEKIVLTAFDSQEKTFLCQNALETPLSREIEIKNCEFLKDVEIFSENTHQSNGTVQFRVFQLTQKGQGFAEKLKQDLLEQNMLDPKAASS